jgi:membrane protease YdiL (CAAX protease family)
LRCQLKICIFVLADALFFDLRVGIGNSVFDEGNVLKIFLNVVILAPFFEEMAFRYYLSFSRSGTLISLLFAGFLFYDGLVYLVVFVIYLLILLLLIERKVRINRLMIVYFSSFIFALSHLIAYKELSSSYGVAEMLFVLGPHFIAGLLLSYVFFRNGIFVAIALHSLWNLIPYLLFLLKLAVMEEI